MSVEVLTWAAIGISALVYIRARRAVRPPGIEYGHAPSAQLEVDPTRWRHDGTQPLAQHDGNRYIGSRTFAEEDDLRSTMRF